MTDITFSDISQWQPDIDAPAYLKAGHTVLICRTYSADDGSDNEMPERRDYLRQFDFDALGWYQRLNADRDPAAQARDFINTTGPLRDNEFPILDLEDGDGNQIPRAEAWFKVVDDWCGFQAALYSGEWFLGDKLGGPARWGKRPLWIANYTDNGKPNANEYPSGADWWQFSSTHHFPGLDGGVDANLYHGNGAAFLKTVRPGAALTAEPAPTLEGRPTVLNKDGRLEVFAGNVAHRWQTKPGQQFNDGWASLGRPDKGAQMVSSVANKDGRLEVFIVTSDNEVFHRWQQKAGGVFNDDGWASLGCPGNGKDADTKLSAIVNKDGRVEVFAEVKNGEVFHRWQEKPNAGFHPGWSSLGKA